MQQQNAMKGNQTSLQNYEKTFENEMNGKSLSLSKTTNQQSTDQSSCSFLENDSKEIDKLL